MKIKKFPSLKAKIEIQDFPVDNEWAKIQSEATSFMDALAPLEVNDIKEVRWHLQMAYAYHQQDIAQLVVMLDWNDVWRPLELGKCRRIQMLPPVKANTLESLMNKVKSYCEEYVHSEKDTFMLHYLLPASSDSLVFRRLMELYHTICPKSNVRAPLLGCSLLADKSLPFIAVMVVYKGKEM